MSPEETYVIIELSKYLILCCGFVVVIVTILLFLGGAFGRKK